MAKEKIMRTRFVVASLLLLSALCLAKNAPDLCLISMAVPQYPLLARTARIQGVVQLKISINAAGEVTEVAVISGPKMLTESALTNVKTWRFGPSSNKITMPHKYILDDHLIEGNDCCRFKMDGPMTVEIYGGATLVNPTISN